MPQPIWLPIMSLPSPVNSGSGGREIGKLLADALGFTFTTIHSLSVLLRKKAGIHRNMSSRMSRL